MLIVRVIYSHYTCVDFIFHLIVSRNKHENFTTKPIDR